MRNQDNRIEGACGDRELEKWRKIQVGRTAGAIAQGTWCQLKMNLTVKEGRGWVGAQGDKVEEVSRARMLQGLVGELLKGFEQERNKLWFTFFFF